MQKNTTTGSSVFQKNLQRLDQTTTCDFFVIFLKKNTKTGSSAIFLSPDSNGQGSCYRQTYQNYEQLGLRSKNFKQSHFSALKIGQIFQFFFFFG